MWDPFAEFVHKKIEGGVDIYASQWPGRSLQRMAILVHAGCLQDAVGREGTAHLLEHLIRYGGKADGQKKIHEFFENLGGVFEPTTDLLSTEYVFDGPATKEFLSEALTMLYSRIFNFPANPYLLKKEKGIVSAEFRKDNPWQYILDNNIREDTTHFSQTLLKRCILPTEGLPEIIDKISVEDLRNFHCQFYFPANISIFTLGGLAVEEIFQLITDSPFSAVSGQRVKLPETLIKLPPLTENNFNFSAGEFLKECAGVNVSRIKISAVLPGNISEQLVKMCFEMIDEGLDDEVRENCNWSYGSKTERNNYASLHHIALEFADLPPDKVAETDEVIKRALFSLPNNKELFERKKLQSLNRLKLLDYNIEKLIEDGIAEITHNQRLPTFTEKYAEREAITMDDIKKVFSYLTADRLWTLTQRP